MSDNQRKKGLARLGQNLREASTEAKPQIRANAKWAKNTAIGTAKGVAIAAAATSVAEIVRQTGRKTLRHKSR